MMAVEAEGVSFRFPNRVAVDTSDLAIPAGCVTAVIGPNGSGKTTLLNGIAGLHRPSGGRLTVLGHRPEDIRSRIAYVLQYSKINEAMPVTVREVVAIGRYASLGPFGRMGRDDRDQVERAMERMDICSLANRHLVELSGGERQRVFVAQGLAQERDMLLLDEPLTGLDLVSARTIDEVIHAEQALGVTVILTTHDLAEARVADYVVLMAGRVISAGPPDVALSDTVLAEAYGSRVLHFQPEEMLDDPAHVPAKPRPERPPP